jgi:putative oxidoreductase
VLRIVVGILFSMYGYQKFFAWFGGMGGAPAPLASQLGVAGMLETFGGAMIILGLFTRPVAFLLSGQMAFAYFLSHAPRGWNPHLNGGEPAVVFCFTYLWLTAAGAGPWSIDALMGRKV